MSAAKLLNGREVAERHARELERTLAGLAETGVRLCLATLQVGRAEDTELYARSIERLLKRLQIDRIASISPLDVGEDELAEKIELFNSDPTVTGILLFAPLPARLNTPRILNAIDPLKDVEGRRLFCASGASKVLSPTALAVGELIAETGRSIAGLEAVVIGHSDVVGKPAAILLMDKFATVTVCHVKTRDLEAHVRRADIVVAAAGKAGLVKGEWIRPGAIVVDVGENVVAGKLVGDVEFEEAARRAAFISPVPGGVGPLTNLMLVHNLLSLQRLRTARSGA
ncbi:MAG: Bifunctional protein FolD protein [Candidatus Omnitrophica bacterium]|nr:Bifunctional protein FolD protein [Candidatus Omnitrophota bacterium]